MASQRRREKATYASVRQMERIDMLLAKQPEYISMITGAEIKITKQPEISKKEQKRRMLEGPKVKYAYSKDSKVIHDKSCSHVDGIKLENLRVSKEYIKGKFPCPECKLNAYIREGGDFLHREEYLRFFERAYFDEKQIKDLFISGGAKTKISGNVMTIKMNGNLWKIRILDDEEYGLELSKGDDVIKKWINSKEAMYYMEHKSWTCFDSAMLSIGAVKRFKRWWKYFKKDVYRLLRTSKRELGGLNKRSVYYIDGDNDPEKRVKGIEELSRKDVVKIFCAKNNSHYSNYDQRETLKNKCKCKIVFIPVMPGPDAVDFAIGIDAYGTFIKKPRNNIFLLSADKHFTVIKRQIDILSHGMANVKHIGMICEAG